MSPFFGVKKKHTLWDDFFFAALEFLFPDYKSIYIGANQAVVAYGFFCVFFFGYNSWKLEANLRLTATTISENMETLRLERPLQSL